MENNCIYFHTLVEPLYQYFRQNSHQLVCISSPNLTTERANLKRLPC